MKKKDGVFYAISAIVLLCICEWFFFRKMYGSALLFGGNNSYQASVSDRRIAISSGTTTVRSSSATMTD